MKKTGSLKISVSTDVDRTHVVMHPNEGFDLGLMRIAHPVELCRGIGIEDYLKGLSGVSEPIAVSLLNECPKETVLLGPALHRLLGEPEKGVVLFDGQRLFVHKT